MTIRCPRCQFDNRAGATFCSQCGVSLSSRDAQGRLLPGTMLEGRYRLKQELGAGGFGAVYLAEDTRLRRACVVKEMLVPPGASAQEVTDLRRNFEREAGSLVALNHPGHPNIPEIYDFFSDPSGNYLVMKYIGGKTLEELMARQGGRLPWRQAVKYAIAVCDALAYMHSHQQGSVLHCDIKPANILVDQAGRTWLVDFGLSKAQPVAWTGTTGGTTAAGTPGYTPLEQWMMRAVPASDVYALGATLHHLVTGRDPCQAFTTFDLVRIKQEHSNFPPLRTLDASLPAELERLVADAVKANPRQRPGASQWKQALEALVTPSKVARPFTFQSGDVARTPKDLAPLCDRFWDEARDYLYGGQFEKWFVELNRHDLVAKLKAITGQEKRRDVGLEKFLRHLNPNLPSPGMSVKRTKTDFGRHEPSAKSPPSARIQIHNHGRGCLYGSLKLNAPWLHISQQDFSLAPGKMLELEVSVKLDQLGWGKRYKGQLVIDSNGGRVQIDHSLRTPSPIFSRQAMLKRFGFAGGFSGGVWGALLGIPLWVLVWFPGLRIVFHFILYILAILHLNESFQAPQFDQSQFDKSLLGLTIWNALLGATVGILSLGSSKDEKMHKTDRPISFELHKALTWGLIIGVANAFVIAGSYIVDVDPEGWMVLLFIIATHLIIVGFAVSIPICLLGAIIGGAWAVMMMLIRLIMWGLLNLVYPARRGNL